MLRDLPVIDMAELVRLQICVELDDTWAWVAPGPERQQVVAADPAPVQAPQLPPPAMGRTMPQRLGRLEEEMQGLRQDVRSLCGLVERSMTYQGKFSTWMISCMTQLMEASEQTYQAFNGTFRGSSQAVFERRTRQRTDGASTSVAPISQTHDPSIPYLFYLYLYIYYYKTGSKFSIIVHEYVMEPSTLSKSRAELRKESVYKSMEAKEKSNLKTSL
ncbi:hypothetical protein Tco_0252591 [Tanacetum coccineum]